MADRSQSDSSSRSASFSGLLIDAVTPTGTVLGRGSYGKVLEVDWHGTVCAAKNVHDIFLEGVSAAESRRVISDFERECQTWSQLRHPNVVQLLGVYFKKGSSAPILVLEKMDTTLSGYLERHSKEAFPIPHKVSVLRQVAQALSYLHNQNPPLVHHDLSTNNILLCEWSFQAKITDFGMTRPISVAALTRRSSIKGTLAFMAPEALREPPRYDVKLDVFSYGNVIIAILTHQWPTPDVPNRYEGEQLVALTEFQRREHHIISLSKDEKTHFLATIQSSLDNRPHRRPASSELVTKVKHIEADLVQQVPHGRSSWPAICAELREERDLLVTERNTLTTEKHKLEETVADLNVIGADLKKSVEELNEMNVILQLQNSQFQQDFAAVQLEKQELQLQLLSSKANVQNETRQVSTMACNLCYSLICDFRTTCVQVHVNTQAVKKVPPPGITSASGEGGKQGEETFPSVQAQLDKLRPLMKARLQQGRTW